MRRALVAIVAVLAVIGSSAAVATPAHADNCRATTLKATTACFNVRLNNQFKAIQKINHELASGPTTSAAVAAAIAKLNNDVADAQNTADNVQQRTNCWGSGLKVSEFTTNGNPFGSIAAAGGFPYAGTSDYSYLDMFHTSEPSDQNFWNVIVNQC